MGQARVSSKDSRRYLGIGLTLTVTSMNPLSDGWTMQDVEAVIARDLPEELRHVPVAVSMDPPDCSWSESICLRLAEHQNFNVRGNAVLALGHLARACGSLTLDRVLPIVSAALGDQDEYVRGQAYNAASDIYVYLGVIVPGYSPVSRESG